MEVSKISQQAIDTIIKGGPLSGSTESHLTAASKSNFHSKIHEIITKSWESFAEGQKEIAKTNKEKSRRREKRVSEEKAQEIESRNRKLQVNSSVQRQADLFDIADATYLNEGRHLHHAI